MCSNNNVFQYCGYFRPKDNDTTLFDNRLDPVMLVSIRKLSLSTNVPGVQSFVIFVIAKLAISSMRVIANSGPLTAPFLGVSIYLYTPC